LFDIQNTSKESGPSEDPAVRGRIHLRKGYGEAGLGFEMLLEGATKQADTVSPVSTQHSTIRYKVVVNTNRRTAEQGTEECRTEKYCLTAFKNFCCSKFLVRYSIFKIQVKNRGAIKIPLCWEGPAFELSLDYRF
jgi:hypothetical protein